MTSQGVPLQPSEWIRRSTGQEVAAEAARQFAPLSTAPTSLQGKPVLCQRGEETS